MTLIEKLEGDEEGKKLLKRRRTRLAAWPPAQTKVMMVHAKRRRKGPEIRLIALNRQPPMRNPLKRKRRGQEMSRLRKLSPACVV